MKDIDLLVEVARMYYDQDLTQQEIADKIYVSRSRVSRLIKKAKALGIVEIIIKPSFENHHNLEKILRDRFSLKDVLVAYSVSRNRIRVKERDGKSETGKGRESQSYQGKQRTSMRRPPRRGRALSSSTRTAARGSSGGFLYS